MSQVEEVLYGIYEAINTGNLALLDEFVAPTTPSTARASRESSPSSSGRRISVEAVDIGRIENSQAKERWGGLNLYSMLTQLGVIPAPQPS
jgi:hypothetical protein